MTTLGRPRPTAGRLTLPADPGPLLAAAARVPTDVLDAVGTGGLARVPTAVNGEPVVADGRPRVIWVGADSCAECAAMRWSMVVALSRFGSLSGLALVASDADAAYPGTVGPSFAAATWLSSLLDVTFYDTPANGDAPTVPAADRALLDRYDAPPYVADDASQPFVLFAGQYVSAGALFTPAVLDGLDADSIAAALNDPGSAVAQAVDGAANVLTAVLCVATADSPAAVCGSTGVTAAAALIGRRTG